MTINIIIKNDHTVENCPHHALVEYSGNKATLKSGESVTIALHSTSDVRVTEVANELYTPPEEPKSEAQAEG